MRNAVVMYSALGLSVAGPRRERTPKAMLAMSAITLISRIAERGGARLLGGGGVT